MLDGEAAPTLAGFLEAQTPWTGVSLTCPARARVGRVGAGRAPPWGSGRNLTLTEKLVLDDP